METSEEYKSIVEPMKTKEEAAAYVANTIDQGFAAVCLGLGATVGLFDVLVRMDGPATAEEIATAGEFKEKYTKELIAVMVYHKRLCYDERREKFWLPETHKECLTGVNSTVMPLVPLLTLPFHDLVACFKKNGPRGFLPDDPTVHDHNERLGRLIYTTEFIENIIMSKDSGLNQKLDHENEKSVLQIKHIMRNRHSGIGPWMWTRTHVIPMVLAKRFPKCEIVGIDIYQRNIRTAREKAEAEELSHVDFVAMDVYKMPTDWTGRLDVSKITIHDLPYVVKALKEVRRVLTPGGRLLLLKPVGHSNIADNINDPGIMFRQVGSLLHCMPGSLYFENGDGVGMTWGQEKMKSDLQEAGFDVIFEDNISPTMRLVISKPAEKL